MGRIAFIASSAGSAFDTALTILARTISANFIGVVVDRQCRYQQVAARHRLPCRLVPYTDARSFSARASDILRDRSAELDGLAISPSACPAVPTRRMADILVQWPHFHCPSVIFHD
ncbi:MAG: hypothetical protein EBR10_07710 [Planctomycetes bacterium]|nr:hypothetical protein [Planctomycetota bacterium]